MASNSRSKNVALNAGWAIISQVVAVVLGLASRKIFLDHLGAELLGVNSLFTDVLALFSFADLGFGTAIMFSMYAPIANNDTSKVASYLLFFKQIYRYVIAVVILISIAFIPFLSSLKTDIPIGDLRIYYLFFQIGNVLHYVWAYRESYVIARQEERILSMASMIYSVVCTSLLIISVLVYESFILYLIVQFSCIAIKKVVVNHYITRKYPITKLEGAVPLNKEEKKSVISKSMALLVTKIGNLAINQTDSLIVSYMINVIQWGYASTYLMLKTTIKGVADKFYSAVLPSMGNLTSFNDKKKNLNIFLKYDFLNSWLYIFCFVGLGCLSTPFISLFFGESVTLSKSFVFFFLLAYLVDGLRSPISLLREATGSYEVDKWYTIVAAVVNIAVSIPLAKFYGLNGVYIGTIFAMIVLHVTRTYVLFHSGEYDITVVKYLLIVLNHVIVGVIIFFATDFVCGKVAILPNGILSFILQLFIVLLVPNILLIAIYRKNAYYIEYRNLIITKILKR